MLFGWLGLIFGFSGLIFVHEFGHFILAKWNGVRVHVFSLGMGPYLVSFTWRETVYVLSMIPLGGYVKLAGQDDLNPNQQLSQDPRDYRNKRPGQRAAILAAGAIFNLLFTLVIFTFCYWHGVGLDPARIGLILPGKPLAKATLVNDGTPAQLKEGDRIIEVNGVPVKSFMEATLQVAGARGEDLYLRVQRQTGGIVYVKVQTRQDKTIGAPGIGLVPYNMEMSLPLGFKTKDTVFIAATPAKAKNPKDDSPAAKAGGFKRGDEVLSIGGRPIEKIDDMLRAAPLSEGQPQTFVLRRKGEPLQIVLTPEKREDSGTYWFGLSAGLKREVTEIDEQSEAYQKGLRQGHYIFYFQPNEEEWVEGAGEPNPKLVWKHGELKYGKKWNTRPKNFQTIALTVPPPESGLYVFTQELQALERFKCVNWSEALSVAWGDTLRFTGDVFTVLRGLFNRSISPSALSGPIGIGHFVYTVASTQTAMMFLWFLGFISLNLGVFQFIPIPLLDGWHLLMVLIEKLKGSPVAPRIQEAFQYVGLFVIGALVLLVTYNDIFRFLVR